MSFPTEALVIGAREALKAVLLWLVLASVLQGRRSLGLYWMGLALGLAAGAWGALVGLPEGATWWLRRLGGYVFFLCFFFALGAFLQGAGYNLAGPLRGLGRPLLPLLVLVLLLSFLPPDFAQAGGFLAELALMREDALGVWGLALAGFSATAVAGFLLARRLRGGLGAFLGLGEVLLSLALIKLLLGGTRGFAELSLIPAVRQGVMKFIHDAVHQLFVFFMVPDHPLLQTTVWTFIGVLFSPQVAVYGVLALLMLPPLWQLRMALFAPLPEPPEPLRAARRRAFKARVRAQRLRRAVPVAVFVVAVLASWFSGKAQEASALYNPQPVPLVAEETQVLVPLASPTWDLMDGNLHKFSVDIQGQTVVFLVMKRPDGKLTVCLDDCEVCPPEGYAQAEGHVLCLYCATPIPLESLGQPGGCNPIPLKFHVTERHVVVELRDLTEKWLKERAKE